MNVFDNFKKLNLLLSIHLNNFYLDFEKVFIINKYFFYNFYVFSFYKAREISSHFPCIPGLSKHFFEIKMKLANAQTIIFIPKKSRHFYIKYKDCYV